MKKIAVWKVVLFSLLTLGVYSIVWLALRRNEIVKQYGLAVPHWLWLVVPMVTSLSLLFTFLIGSAIVFAADLEKMALSMMIGMLVLTLIPFVISVWWVTQFGKAVAKITAGRVPTIWTALIYVFCGGVVVAVHQYYFNRYAGEKLSSETKKPSELFVVIASIAIVLSAVASAISFAEMPADFERLKQDMSKESGLLKKAENLTEDYNKCIERLEADYPGELTMENEAAYMEAYDKCEDIRKKQHDAAGQYNAN